MGSGSHDARTPQARQHHVGLTGIHGPSQGMPPHLLPGGLRLGAGLPDTARVRRVLVTDGADVNAGDPLLALDG